MQLLEDLLDAGDYKRQTAAVRQHDGSEADAEDVGPLLQEVKERTNRLRPVSVVLPHTIPATRYDKFLAALRSFPRPQAFTTISAPKISAGGATALVENGASKSYRRAEAGSLEK